MELFVRSAGRLRRADKDEILAAAAQFSVVDLVREPVTSPKAMRELLVKYLSPRDSETFCVFWLDGRHRVIAFEELFQGTLDGAPVYPREMVKRALARNAAAVVLCHHHPSSLEVTPSPQDEIITQRVRQALEVIEVRVLDHLIVAGTKVFSFAERGLI